MPLIILIDFMGNKTKILLSLIFLMIGCGNKKQQINYDLAIETSLNYIVKNINLPEEYKTQPLQIIPAKDHWVKELTVNSKKCIILSSNTNVYKMMEGMDIFKPIPIAEVTEIKHIDGLINLEIIFRSTGHAFSIKLKETKGGVFSVMNVSEYTI